MSEVGDAPHSQSPSLRAILEMLSHLATTVGIFLLIYQLSNDASYKKSERSLAFVNEYIGGAIAGYRVALLKPWMERGEELEIIRRAGGARREDVQAFVEFALTAHDAQHPEDRVKLAVHELGSFFDRVELCVASSVCDPKVIHDYFRAPATQFHCLYGTVLMKQAVTLGSPELGSGLVRLRGDKKC
jgi:hypothetical protein